jgi:hypothetical protein
LRAALFIRILLAQEFDCQTYTFQRGTLGTVSFCPNMAQGSQCHAGMCTFESQILMSNLFKLHGKVEKICGCFSLNRQVI